jgi:hypothetical protein
LIALIINTHPKIDELMLSIVFSKSMPALWVRPAIQPLEQALK